LTLSIHLLGRFDIQLDGIPLDSFSTDKVRALLAYLAVENTYAHRREKLATLFWPDQTDERARQSLRQALTSLKQCLGGEDHLIITPQSIQIQLSDELQIDAVSYMMLSSACDHHEHRALSMCYPCIQRQIEMADLYEDEFLRGFPSLSSEPFEEWLLLTRENMHQIAMQTYTNIAHYYQQKDEKDLAIRIIRKQLSWIPWHEEGYKDLMSLLASQGNRTAAMAEFERCKSALDIEFGVKPTQETIKLYEQIKENDWKTTAIFSKKTSTFTPFIGRKVEISLIADMMSKPACRLLSIVGAGGSGKTHLALQMAQLFEGLYTDGIYFVPLADTSSCLEAQQATVSCLGAAPEPDSLTQLFEILSTQNLLLILDNFEQLIENCDFLSQILHKCSQVQIIVTSRERLNLMEEWTFSLEGLSYPQTDINIYSNYMSFDAINLYEQRAKQVDSNFQITETQLPHIQKICRLVEGFPLGIELAASTITEQSCALTAEELSLNLAAVESPMRNIPARHRSLSAAFEHSWKLLPESEKIALSSLSVFNGSFTIDAADHICQISKQQIAALGRRSLLRNIGDIRYGFHEIVHQFAREKCGKLEVLQNQHAAYFSMQVEKNHASLNNDCIKLFQNDRNNLLSAWHWSMNQKKYGITEKLLPAIYNIFSMYGPITEGEVNLYKAIENIPDKTYINLICQIYLALGRLLNEQFKIEEAVSCGKYVLDHSKSHYYLAQAYLLEGQAYFIKGDCKEAFPLLQKALEMNQKIQNLQLELDILCELGRVAYRMYDYEDSIQYCNHSLEIAHRLENQNSKGITHTTLGSVYFYLGDPVQSVDHYETALEIFHSLGDRRNQARILNNLSNVFADQGKLSASIDNANLALSIHSEMKNIRGKGVVMQNIGATLWQLGCYEEARKTYEQALAIYRIIAMPHAESEILGNLCLLEGVLENYQKARNYGELSVRLSKESENNYNLANTYQFLGRIELQTGNFETANSFLALALETSTEPHDSGRYNEIQTELAYLEHCMGHHQAALNKMNPIIDLIFSNDLFEGADEPIRIYYLAWVIADSSKDERASEILKKATKLLRQRTELITDPNHKKAFLENIKSHQSLIQVTNTKI
jgi:DNA-binding SARP family transcriptional activator/predicted negative regulator of RcsB-dependent stress response